MNLIDTLIYAFEIILAVISSVHALISKRDPKSSFGWIAVCILIPFGGPFLYYLFGINRVRSRAEKLQHRAGIHNFDVTVPERENRLDFRTDTDALNSIECPEIVHVSDVITSRTLVGGNRIDVLTNGEEAYPAMLHAIQSARQYVFLTTYIFESNNTGQAFVDALGQAAERGIDVRVIVDGLSDIYRMNWASRRLKKAGVSVARFLPPQLIPPVLHINLRNHRKILIADGQTGFTGGMNIGDSYLAERHDNPDRVVDLHFRLKGSIVKQIEDVFMEDWGFITGNYEILRPAATGREGSALCRVITEGPNEDMDKLTMILTAAVSAARESVVIMTPYFIPPRGLLAVLQAAALRGLRVTVVLPAKNDFCVVHWATRNLLWELLDRGVRVYYQPPPFVHTKLVIIDQYYVHIGSANIDPRSLRLNFELAVEIFDRPLAEKLTRQVESVIKRSKAFTLEDVDGRSFPAKLRDSLAWLFSPYL
ncbi:MAG: cardiolipin synthase [Deltaproteobacteria bacterium]|nr:cardiolipin synthase [Deltaproteobacteria bacterium]